MGCSQHGFIRFSRFVTFPHSIVPVVCGRIRPQFGHNHSHLWTSPSVTLFRLLVVKGRKKTCLSEALAVIKNDNGTPDDPSFPDPIWTQRSAPQLPKTVLLSGKVKLRAEMATVISQSFDPCLLQISISTHQQYVRGNRLRMYWSSAGNIGEPTIYNLPRQLIKLKVETLDEATQRAEFPCGTREEMKIVSSTDKNIRKAITM